MNLKKRFDKYIYIYIFIFFNLQESPFSTFRVAYSTRAYSKSRADWTLASPSTIFVKSATVCVFSTPWGIYSVFISPR